MRYFQKKYIPWVLCCLIAFGGYIVYYSQHSRNQIESTSDTLNQKLNGRDASNAAITSEEATSKTLSNAKLNQSDTIMVDVKGDVLHPGVYPFHTGDRVLDAIKKSGGFNPKADQRRINLAQKLTDEMVIYIPKIGENPPTSDNSPSGNAEGKDETPSKQTLVHLNSATLEQLETLPGIGPTKAQAILDYRQQIGSFKSIEDLLKVTGIGEKSLEKIKGQLSLN